MNVTEILLLSTTRRIILGAAALAPLAASCAGKGSASDQGQGDSQGGSSAGAPAQGGSGGRGGGNPMIDAANEVSNADAFDACEVDESTATAPGLDIYIVFDRSGSMAQDPNGQNTDGVPEGETLGDCPIDLNAMPASESRWCRATNALAKFFTGATDRDVRVAFQFMTPAQNYDVCGEVPENPHATSLVELTRLPVPVDHALVAALADDFPRLGTTEGVTSNEFGTRIEGAFNGIVRFTREHQEPSRTTIGILITDGDPNQCQDEDIEALGRIAGDHYGATGVPIFVVGMTGATADSLEILARLGGAPEHDEFCDSSHSTCHYWTVGDGQPEAFRDALHTIQETAIIPCEYTLPDPGAGVTLDPGLVQVRYAPPGEAAEEIFKVRSVDDCDPSLGGWFYDDAANPTRIFLCAGSCERVNAPPGGGTLSLAYGCAPVVR
jgi:hypothetical protein